MTKRIKIQDKPLISIYTLAYNGSDFLDQCAKSVLSQTYKNIEFLIILNGKSIDNTSEKAYNIADSDSRVRVLSNDGKTSISDGRWFAINNMVGEYFLDIDQDDLFYPNAIEGLHCRALETEAEIVCGRITRYWAKGHSNLVGVAEFDKLLIEDYLPNALQYMDFYMHGKLYKRTLFIEESITLISDLYDGEDVLLHFQAVLFAQNISMYNVPVYKWMQQRESSTENMNYQKLKSSFRVFLFLDRLYTANVFPKIEKTRSRFLGFILVRIGLSMLSGKGQFLKDYKGEVDKYVTSVNFSVNYINNYVKQYKIYYFILRLYLVSENAAIASCHLLDIIRRITYPFRKG